MPKKLPLPEMTFIIPSYNAAEFIEGCIESIRDAVAETKPGKWEIILVNDFSTDDTLERVKKYEKKLPLKIITNKGNKGRFLTRKAGLDKAKYEWIMLIDTRTLLNKNSLKFLSKQIAEHPERRVWNPHVDSDAKTNVIAAFNDASVMMVWGRYLRKPRLVSFDITDFDFYPKGATCVLIPRDLLKEAFKEFKMMPDMKRISDDVRMLRFIASKTRIWISPKFSCYYRARNNMSEFIPWVYHRGIHFVDAHFQKGTRFYKFIIMAILAPFVYIALAIIQPWLLLIPVVGWILLMIYLRLRLPTLYFMAVLKLSWLYFFAFLWGLYMGVYLQYRSRRATT